MSVEEKMGLLKDIVDGWEQMSKKAFEISCFLKTNDEKMEQLRVHLPQSRGVGTSETDDLVNSILGYHEMSKCFNDVLELQLAKLLQAVHKLADKIDPEETYDF